jgi:hypothetical protein
MVRLSIVLFPALACAQEDHSHRNNVAVGFGAAIPVGSTTNYLSAAPLLTLRYGYRFNRFFQADAGFQAAFGAANNPNAEMTDFGAVQGGDHEFTIPLGGRIYIPIPLKRIEISAGGGAAYLHYSETVPSSGFEISTNCYSCTSRGGWGGYGLANARYFLDENHNFHVGATLQFISASTNGSAVANIPPIRTTDHWTNFSFEFGLSF